MALGLAALMVAARLLLGCFRARRAKKNARILEQTFDELWDAWIAALESMFRCSGVVHESIKV